ncbi:MAG: hypothetical protein FJY74_06235 [Candidatus Eisenbacteria bacterium]|nr:hypothetical protein [Candidatus Eisenbacteria bacterium]
MVWTWPGDVERLNGLLADDLVFLVVDPSLTRSRADPRGATQPRTASGILVVRSAGGAERRASSSIARPASRRAGLAALSACLAECAMSLGLGTGVYRGAACRERRDACAPALRRGDQAR